MKGSKKQRTSSISKATSYEQMGKFWDTHDFTDFEGVHEVQMDVDIQTRQYYVSVDTDLMIEIGKEAARKGISSQSLVNLLIKDHLVGGRK